MPPRHRCGMRVAGGMNAAPTVHARRRACTAAPASRGSPWSDDGTVIPPVVAVPGARGNRFAITPGTIEKTRSFGGRGTRAVRMPGPASVRHAPALVRDAPPVVGGWGTHTPARDHGADPTPSSPPRRRRSRCAGTRTPPHAATCHDGITVSPRSLLFPVSGAIAQRLPLTPSKKPVPLTSAGRGPRDTPGQASVWDANGGRHDGPNGERWAA